MSVEAQADTQHGQSKTVQIIVNGQEKEVPKEKISYETIVKLAYGDNPPSPDTYDLTVTYRRGQAPHEQGELKPGGSVEPVKEMIFNVTPTKKS